MVAIPKTLSNTAPMDHYNKRIHAVTRPFCLVKSRSQDVAANADMLSVYLTTIMYIHRQLFTEIERENINRDQSDYQFDTHK